MLSVMLMLQVASIPWIDLDFDLRRVPPAPVDPEAIIVSARRAPPQRFVALPEGDELYLPRAEMSVFGNGKLSIDVDQRVLGNVPSNWAMLTLKMKF